jgi:tetratricopeptide (TPR) repeat protein
VIALLLFLLAASTPQELVRQGNSAMREQRYQEAVPLYESAVAMRPDSAEAHFDLGGAYYRLGDYSRALDSFERASRLRRKGRLSGMARYNAAHCMFQQGLGLVYTDPESAIAVLEQALASFRESARLESALAADAGHNAEVVKKWLELIARQLAERKSAGTANGPPAAGPGAAIDALLSKDKGIRSAGGANVRPIAAGKDW